MDIRSNRQKFRGHLGNRGLLYALWRAIKYFIFIIRSSRRRKRLSRNSIGAGGIRLSFNSLGISIYWQESEITPGIGLNSAINTLGRWTDSSQADWQIVEKGGDYFILKNRWKNLPVTQTWRIYIKKDKEITWKITMEVKEGLCIDERRVACLVSSRYKSWINGYDQRDFPQVKGWLNISLANKSSRMVGARFFAEGDFLPSLVLEFEDNEFDQIFPLIQNSSIDINAHVLGARMVDGEEKNYYLPGDYNFFSGKIVLFENDSLLDRRIENYRQQFLQEVKARTERGKGKERLKVLLVNLPWQREGKWGVRAGSRWPHIKDRSEGNYLPFPFFLAYATSLLGKHNIEAHIIDAIAEELGEDTFIEKILGMDFHYLVAETSIPSFYDDLRMLEKIHEAGIPIILCGPNSEIYKPQFLKEHLFIDFVLYGEYEFSLLELIKRLQENGDLSKVKGLIYRMDKEVVKNPKQPLLDISLFPWPNRKQLPMDKYWDLPGDIPFPSVQVLASRGCPFGCNFCLWPQVLYQSNLYRTRDIKDVVGEMEYLVRGEGFKSVYFDDDTFNISKERMLRFCQAIKEKGLQNIPWAIMARPDLMDEEILTEMKSAGLWAVKYGVESIFERLLRNYQKNMIFQKVDRVIKITKNLGIKIHLTFTFGIYGETKDTIQKTIDYALSSEPDSVQFSILTPFPGTRLFEEFDRQGRILTKDWSKYDGHYRCVFQPDNLSPQDLERAKEFAYRLWGEYLRKKRGFWGNIGRFRDYLQKYGFKYALFKTRDYLKFARIERDRDSFNV